MSDSIPKPGTPEWDAWVEKVAPGENVQSIDMEGRVYAIIVPPGVKKGKDMKPGDRVTYLEADGTRQNFTVPTKERAEELFGLFQRFLGLGSNVLVKAEPDQPSILEPGKLSVVSQPMDKFVDINTFLDELASFMREPLFPLEDMVLKECTCEELSENKFIIKVEHDRKKWNRFGLRIPENAPPLIRTWYTCEVDYEKLRFTTIDHALKGPPYVQGISVTQCHKDPFRIEFWLDTKDMETQEMSRRSGSFMATYCQNFYINPIILKVQKRVAKIIPESDALTDEGELSVLTEGLDEFCNYDEVFDGFMDHFKSGATQNLGEGKMEIEKDSDGEIVMAFQREKFEKWQATPENEREVRPPMFMEMKIEHNREECYINMENVMSNSDPIFTKVRLHQCPLRVEFWMITDGKRIANRSLGNRLQGVLDGLIAKAEGAWFW